MLPYAVLIIGTLATALPRPAAIAATAALLGSLGVGTLGAIGDDGQRPRYREAAAYIAEHARPGDVIVERELFPDLGPWSPHFAIYAPERVPYYREGSDEPGPATRVFYVNVPTAGAAPETVEGLVPVDRHELPGIHPVLVTTYAER
jgi:hypothetical protein